MRAKSLAVIGTSLAVAVLAATVPAVGPAFRYGVAAGEITIHSAKLWTRANHAGAVTLEVAREVRFAHLAAQRKPVASTATDLTVQAVVKGLEANTAYVYRFRQGKTVSRVGRFRTAPEATQDAPVRFAISGDADATPAAPSAGPFFNHFEVYARMAGEANAFNINLGDTIYSDSGVGATPPALTLDQKWAKYRLNLSVPALTQLRATAGLYSHWDDHEFVNDFTRAEHGEELYRAGVKAFGDYTPVTYNSDDGLFRSFRWGKNLELFFLDERSFRSAKASAVGTCNVPGGGPDLAPTAPQAVRDAFAGLVPALAQPVAPACLAAIADPQRTILGAHQYDRFTTAIARSTATFKVIVNEVPIQQFYALPYDRWEGYAAERTRLIEFLRANVRNVIFLATDTHATFVNDVRLQTLEPPGPVNSGILEVVTGPVATNTFAKEIDATLRSHGTGIVISSLFFKPGPSRGVGMQCAAPDVYSYAEVEATNTTVTITPKDAAGKRVVDVTGADCGVFVVHAR
jgi:alkaline phosphatase D